MCISNRIPGAVHISISFRFYYGFDGFAEFHIMDFESFDMLRKDGLLLVFGDATLRVRSGTRETLFSYDTPPWADSGIVLIRFGI